LLVGDKEGVVVIPANIIDEIANEVNPMTIYEDYVIDKVRNGSSIKGLYPLTDKNEKKMYEKWLKSNSKEN
jgi:regulator of RNase E activity RraA